MYAVRGRSRILAAWLACLAMLLDALAPSLAHAIGTADRAMFAGAEVCGFERNAAAGPARSADDPATADNGAPAQPARAGAVHCPYCLLAAASIGIPPAQRDGFPLTAVDRPPPAFFDAEPRPRIAASSAHAPRAPPVA